MPSAIRATPFPAQKLSAQPKPAAAPGESAPQPAKKPLSAAPPAGRDGALAAISGASTFKPSEKPLAAGSAPGVAEKPLGTAGSVPGAAERPYTSALKALGTNVKPGASAPNPSATAEKPAGAGATASANVLNAVPDETPGTTANAVPEPPSDPNQRAEWWNGLTPEQQSQQIAADPQQIGSLDGLPASARDQANRQVLEQDIARLEADAEQAQAEALEASQGTPSAQDVASASPETFLPEEERRQLENARAVQAQLDRVEEQTDPVTGEPLTAQLLVYDPTFVDGEGRAAIAVGNVDTADHVAVSVPGLDSNVRDYMDNLTGNALNLYNESRRAGGDVATVAWLGYDAPTLANVAVDNAAENGAPLLAADVAAIRASRGDNQPHLTVIGHSYGSTTASIAADRHGLAADDLVLIGSPGAGHADNVSDYEGIDSEHVWAGSASRDPVTHLNDKDVYFWDPLGLDPSLDSFGANRFRAEAVDRSDGFIDFSDHSKYYNENSESLFNLASITTGNYDRVMRAEHREETFLGLDISDPEHDRDPGQPHY